MPSNHLILCWLLLLPSIFPSIRVFSNESVLHIRWPNYWSFSVSISPFNEYSGLISFRIDRLDLPAVQGTLKSILQHNSSKTSILWHSAFFIVQLSHPYMTTGKIIALTRWTFVGKVMSLLFNMLSRLGSRVVEKGHSTVNISCCCSVAQLYLTLCDSMDCSTPGFPVLPYLLEFAQIHVHWVDDGIRPSHPLLPPSPPALSLSQQQGPFQLDIRTTRDDN